MSTDKKQNAWTLFQKRIRELTGLSSPETMQLCSFLKGRKEASEWLDAEIMEAMPRWRLEAKPKEVKEVKAPKAVKESQPSPTVITEAKEVKEEKEVKTVKEPKAVKAVKAPKAVKESQPSPAVITEVKEVKEVKENSSDDLLTVLTETKAKLSSAVSSAEKKEEMAKKEMGKAVELKKKADETMQAAIALTKKADEAVQAAGDLEKKAGIARATADACQKDLDTASAAVAARSKELEAAAVHSTESEEPLHLRRKKIPKHIKTLVWNKYMGVDTAQSDCVSCRSVKITNRSFHCGHVIAESKGGDLNINNLRPICEACNGSMGTRSMNEFTQEFFGWSV